MSKGKSVSIPATVEAQIRTRARNLPIHQCYINKDWEESQLAFIAIFRKHTNGNITVGRFQVDLKLLGVKECHYKFNESSLLMGEIHKTTGESWVECDYNLAHNIIYAGLEFAEDYGFAPHKNFKTAQYILEEDTDDIPIIDVPLGDNGIPVLVVPYSETGQREMSILNKTAGDDYRVIFLDKDGKPEIGERTYQEIVDEVLAVGVDNYMKKDPDHPNTPDSIRETQVLIDLIYLIKGFTEEEKNQIDLDIKHILKDPRLAMIDDTVKDYEEELARSVRYFMERETDKATAEVRKVIDRHPDDPLLWAVLLYNLSVDSEVVDEEVVKEAYSLFPDHPVIKAWYAEWLAQEDREDEVFALFDNAPGLDALTTENRHINAYAFTSFCYAYAAAWLHKKDILRAEPYYQMIVSLGLDYRLGEYIQQTMTDLKREKIREMLEAGMFGE